MRENQRYYFLTQHIDLRERLLATGNKTLAEASPVDKVRGVGLAADDANRTH